MTTPLTFTSSMLPGASFPDIYSIKKAIKEDMNKNAGALARKGKSFLQAWYAIYPVEATKDGKPFMKMIVSNYGAVYCLRWWWEKVGEWTPIHPKHWKEDPKDGSEEKDK